MKPKDLKCPVVWAERRPILHEGVLFVPPFYDRHNEWQVTAWDDVQLFGNQQPVAVEYCSGNGEWIIDRARAMPEWNWVAVEKRFDRVRKIWSKMRNLGVKNLLVVCGEALTYTRHYLLPASVQKIFINFPDPWPKRGHAKHRLIQGAFVEEIARIIEKSGEACFVTDDSDYSDQIVRELIKSPYWNPLFEAPHFKLEWPNYGSSFFDSLWRAKGCLIRYHLFKRGVHDAGG